MRQPRFALGVIATLALGIAVSTFLFAFLNAVVLRPLPYRDPHELAMLWTNDVKRGIPEEGVGYPTVDDWRAQSRVFASFATCGRGGQAILGGQAEPERIEVAIVSSNLWDVLGVPPMLGRAFTHDEDMRSERVAVISHSLWTRRFGAARDALDRTIDLDGRPYRVIGVMRASFAFPNREVDAWIPLLDHSEYRQLRTRREADFLKVVARLRPGHTLAEADREMNEIGRRLTARYPSSDPDFAGYAVTVLPFARQYVGEALPRALWLLLAAVGFVLLAGCANAAGLMLARNHSRGREFAVRAALGAGVPALLREQLAESLLLASAAGMAGSLAGWWMVRAAIVLAAGEVPRLDEATFDWSVAAFAVLASMLTVLVCGPLAALAAARVAPADAMREGASRGASGSHRAQWWLAAAQAAFTVLLLAGAGLLLGHLLELRRVDPGFRAKDRLLLRVDPTGQAPVFWRSLLARLNAMPGVQAGAIQSFVRDLNPDNTAFVEGRGLVDNEKLAGDFVTPGFFEAAGARLLRGRFFTASEADGKSPAIIVNETMARRFWPGQDPIGKRLQWGNRRREDRPWWVVVGVIQDMRRLGFEQPAVCEAFRAGFAGSMELLVHSRLPVTDVRAAIRAESSSAPVYRIRGLEQFLASSTLSRRLQTLLLGCFAGLALLVAAVGFYATMRQAVVSRRREFGIRLALGAGPSSVFRAVLGSGIAIAAAGAAAGTAGALALQRVMGAMLPGSSAAGGWLILTSSAAFMLVIAGIACAVPAWRAAQVDPARVLRE